MRLPQPVERPADRSALRWVFDSLATLVTLLTLVPDLFRGNPHPNWFGVAAVVVTVVPLVVRRLWPVPVFAWVLAGTAGIGLWQIGAVPGAGVLIALYTVAAMTPRRGALIAAGLVEVGVVIAALRQGSSNWWVAAIFLSGMMVAALGLGLYAGTRRAYLLGLRERAQSLERERDQQGALAAAAERARIAREMHDIVAHHLTVMVALSDGAVAASAGSPERAAEAMRSVSATGRRALADTRRLLGVLRTDPTADPTSGTDQDGDLRPVPDLAELDQLLDQVRAAGLATTLEVHGSPPEVPAGVQLTVYRLVQEALTNTLKHGGAGARATVRLHYRPDELRVEVDDDGAGSTVPDRPPGELRAGGLTGMRERVQAYGGEVRSGPRRPGAGWRVAARLRLDSADEVA